MPTTSCKGCGAPVPAAETRCPYCHAEIVHSLELTPELTADLAAFLKTVDDQLGAAKDENDWLSGVGLLLAVAAVVGGWFGFGAAGVMGATRWVFVLLLGGAGFCIFGLFVGRAEARAVETCYRTRSREQIARFVEAKGLRRVDLDTFASRTLPEKSRLRKFLFQE